MFVMRQQRFSLSCATLTHRSCELEHRVALKVLAVKKLVLVQVCFFS